MSLKPRVPRAAVSVREAWISGDRDCTERVVCLVIKGARRDAGLSQVQLGERLNLTVHQIGKLESGVKGVRVLDLMLIEKAAGVEPGSLLWQIIMRLTPGYVIFRPVG